MERWFGKACWEILTHGDMELAGPPEAFCIDPFVFVADLDGRRVVASFHETAEEDGRVCYVGGLKDGGVLSTRSDD